MPKIRPLRPTLAISGATINDNNEEQKQQKTNRNKERVSASTRKQKKRHDNKQQVTDRETGTAQADKQTGKQASKK